MALTHQARIFDCKQRRALTLLELLVVIGIIALLFALLLPAIQASRESSRRVHCQNNMKQIGLAIGQHTLSFNRLPPGWINSAAGDPGWGWASVILPYLDEAASDPALSPLTGESADARDPPGKSKGKGKANGKAKANAKKAKPIRHADMMVVRETVINAYLCPSDPAPTLFMLHEDGSIEPAVDAAATSWGVARNLAKPSNGPANPSGGKPSKAPAGPKKDKDKETDKGKDKDGGAGPLGQGPQMFELARANYAGMYGTVSIDSDEEPNGVFFENSDLPLSAISDGESTTIFVGERYSRLGESTWVGAVPGAEYSKARVVGEAFSAPNDLLGHFMDFGSYHVGGAYFLLGGGSVKFLADDIDIEMYRSLSTRNGIKNKERPPTLD